VLQASFVARMAAVSILGSDATAYQTVLIIPTRLIVTITVVGIAQFVLIIIIID
jgi:hypothetical protein